MPRLVIISDTHGEHEKVVVPDGDILIHCGDCTNDIGQRSLREFLQWFEAHPHKYKVLVAGNHDGAFERWYSLAVAMVKEVSPSTRYLHDTDTTIMGLEFWGSPYTPEFMKWFNMRKRGADIKRHWSMIPDGTDVLVTHGPPQGLLDLSNNWNISTGEKWSDPLGCADLREALDRVKPKLHCFGHIHGSGGRSMAHIHNNGKKTIMVNASIMDEAYMPVHKAQVFDL